MIFFETATNGQQCELEEHERRALCSRNVLALIAYRENPPPPTPQRDYVARPLATGIPLPSLPTKRKRYRGPSELKRRAERSAAHKQKPVEQPLVTMLAIAPPPASSLLPGPELRAVHGVK